MARRNRTQGITIDPFNPLGNFTQKSNNYYQHYLLYLTMLAYQMFEWKNLPPSVNPSYLERVLMGAGQVAFYKDSKLGYIACEGTASGTLDHYRLPLQFHAHSPNFNKTFPLYNYSDIKKSNMGVLIRNNDLSLSAIPSLQMFAQDLAEIKNIIRVNQNAQKTPNIFFASDKTLLTLKNVAQQIDGNVPNIFVDENLDLNQVKVFDNKAPFIADKMNQMKNSVWNEVMTYLGIKNANLEKKERMVTSEVDSNDAQIGASVNVFLKARLEACEKINELYPDLNIEVGIRENLDLDLIKSDMEGGADDERNNPIKDDSGATNSKADKPKPKGKA